MGKKSKNAKKVGKPKTKDTSNAGLYERYLKSIPRRAPEATVCRHLPSGIVVKENQRKELHEYTGIKHRKNISDNFELAPYIVQWAGQYQCYCSDPNCFSSMPEFVLATLTDYLLEYEYGRIRNQLLDLLFLHSAIEEVCDSGLAFECLGNSTRDDAVLQIPMVIERGSMYHFA